MEQVQQVEAAEAAEWAEDKVADRARAEAGWVVRLLRGRAVIVFARVAASGWFILRGDPVRGRFVPSVE